MRITLTVTAGPHEGRVFQFDRHDTFIVGRAKKAHFRLPFKDKYFSRIHFMVEVNPPQCRLLDLGSRNGTYVNGQRVTSADLKDGDQIKGGHTTISVRVEGLNPTLVEGGPGAPVVVPVVEASPAARSVSPVEYQTIRFATPPIVPAPVAWPRQPLEQPPLASVPAAPASTPCPACGGPLPAAAMPVCPSCLEVARSYPQLVPGYLLVRELGRGGMGTVHQAVCKADSSVVAVKTITPSMVPTAADVERFLREARILRDLRHPHVVAFRDLGESRGLLWFAMDYVRGTDARKLLEANGPLPVQRAVSLMCQVLEALEHAHAKRYVHRDLKPANLLVTQEAGRDVVKVADFGLARIYHESKLSGLTMTGPGGTPAFMPPEQITDFRNVGPAADQYAAAATLYNLLTALYPFDPPPRRELLYALILTEEPVPLRKRRADIPEAVAQAVQRALKKEPEERHAGVKEFREALAAAQS